MAEACGSCCRSFLLNRKTNESLKCACQRPFFSQTVARNNLPTDRDCWIEVPKRFVRHYSSLFGETVTCQGEDGQSYSCPLVGSNIAIVGYGFEWYDFASSHSVCVGDQVVFTLMEGSRFLVQVFRAHVKVEVEVEQVEGGQEWLLAKARKKSSETPSSEVVYMRRNEKVDKKKSVVGMSSSSSPLGESTTLDDAENKEDMEGSETSSSTSDSDWSLGGSLKKEDKKKGSEIKDEEEDGDDSGATTSDDNMKEGEEEERNKRAFRSKAFPRRGKSSEGGGGDKEERMRSSYLYMVPRGRKVSEWAEPGSTMRKTYVSKRGPITCADRDRVFEAAKACPITHNSYLKQLGYDNVYRALVLAIPAPWWRENMPQTDASYKAALVDKEGNTWEVRVRGTDILWGKFSLDHYLEEDDVVVMELADPRIKSLKFLVHIFRAVEVKVTLTGKAGWALHYTIVEGIKKQSQEARKQLLKGRERLKRKRTRGSSHSKSVDSSIKTSHRRPTTRRARRQRKANVEHDGDSSEDSLPLENTRPPQRVTSPTSLANFCQKKLR